MRKYGKVDGNQGDIVDALTSVGASVQSLASVGDGCVDILVGYHGRTFLMEIKQPLGPEGGESHAKLTDDQVKWWAWWNGEPPIIVRSIEEALSVVLEEQRWDAM